MVAVVDNDDGHRRRELEGRVFAMSVACPFGKDRPGECTLCRVRKQNWRDKLRWVQSLPTAELERHVAEYGLCSEAGEERQRGTIQGRLPVRSGRESATMVR